MITPELINLKDYELSGGGKLGESFIKRDNPDILLKIYSIERRQMALDEYERAWKVFKSGISCPEPGELVTTDDGRLGILFKRIHDKKSYARALSEHPELLDKYAAEFADFCKKLHSTKPEPGLFPSAKDQHIKGIMDNPFLTPDEKEGLKHFIMNLPHADTALHGDLHYGNVIFTPDGQKYLIDLSDFCTGTPLFDIGVMLVQTQLISEEMSVELYHINKTVSMQFWNAFVKEYFGPDASPDQVKDMVLPYAFLRILVVEKVLGAPFTQIRPAIHKMINI